MSQSVIWIQIWRSRWTDGYLIIDLENALQHFSSKHLFSWKSFVSDVTLPTMQSWWRYLLAILAIDDWLNLWQCQGWPRKPNHCLWWVAWGPWGHWGAEGQSPRASTQVAICSFDLCFIFVFVLFVWLLTRYVVYTSKLENSDGRVSYPMCFIFSSPKYVGLFGWFYAYFGQLTCV